MILCTVNYIKLLDCNGMLYTAKSDSMKSYSVNGVIVEDVVRSRHTCT